MDRHQHNFDKIDQKKMASFRLSLLCASDLYPFYRKLVGVLIVKNCMLVMYLLQFKSLNVISYMHTMTNDVDENHTKSQAIPSLVRKAIPGRSRY